jgi:hypothetical protein
VQVNILKDGFVTTFEDAGATVGHPPGRSLLSSTTLACVAASSLDDLSGFEVEMAGG